MINISPLLSTVDVVILLSRLWEQAKNSVMLNSSKEDFLAGSITFFKEHDRLTVGIVYTVDGGMARVFNGQMKVVAQTIEKISQEDYYGIYKLMSRIQEDLPAPEDPEGVTGAI